MSKAKLISKWSIVFVVMGFFTMQSLAALNIIGGNKAYADAIHGEHKFNGHNKFVVMNGDDETSVEASNETEARNRHFQRAVVICSLDQNQLDTIQDEYATQIKSFEIDTRTISYVQINADRDTRKNDLYATVGIDKHDCKIITQNRLFYMFLMPGVS